MVTVRDFQRRENEQGEPFNVLVVEGEAEAVKSKKTGKYYITARRTTIPSTFGEDRCQELIGTQLPGTIERVPTERYEYEIPETGEVIHLEHTYEYNPEPSTMEEHVFEGQENGKKVKA